MKFGKSSLVFLSLFMAIKTYGFHTDFSLDGAKKLEVTICKSDDDCKKNYELGCYIEDGKKEGHCLSTFFCNAKDKCVFEVDNENNVVNYESVTTGYSFFHFSSSPTLILESCNSKNAKKEACYTRECEKNSECFSNKCSNNVCITDEKKPLYVCSNDISLFTDMDTAKFDRANITCKLEEQEICKKNSDCATNKCQKINGAKICVREDMSYLGHGGKTVRFIFEIFLVICAALIIYTVVKCCLRNNAHRKIKKVKDVKVKREMEEAFLHNNKNYVELEDIDEYDISKAEQRFADNKL